MKILLAYTRHLKTTPHWLKYILEIDRHEVTKVDTVEDTEWELECRTIHPNWEVFYGSEFFRPDCLIVNFNNYRASYESEIREGEKRTRQIAEFARNQGVSVIILPYCDYNQICLKDGIWTVPDISFDPILEIIKKFSPYMSNETKNPQKLLQVAK